MEEAINLSPVVGAIASLVDEMESCGVYAPKAPTAAKDVWVLQFGQPNQFNLTVFDEALKNAGKRVVVILSCNRVNKEKWIGYMGLKGYPVLEVDDRTYVVAKDS